MKINISHSICVNVNSIISTYIQHLLSLLTYTVLTLILLPQNLSSNINPLYVIQLSWHCPYSVSITWHMHHSGIKNYWIYCYSQLISLLCHASLLLFLFLEVQDPGHVCFPFLTLLIADCPFSSLGRQPCTVLWHHVDAETFSMLCAFWIPHM